MRQLKLFVLILGLLLFGSNNSFADRCVYNDEVIFNAALNIIKNLGSAVEYCPTCHEENANLIKKFEIKEVTTAYDKKYGWEININGDTVDLAYIYIPTEKQGIYRNLGHITKCRDYRGETLDNTLVKEYLDEANPYGYENIVKLRKKVEDCEDKECINNLYHKIMKDYSVAFKEFICTEKFLTDSYSKEYVLKVLWKLADYYGGEPFFEICE